MAGRPQRPGLSQRMSSILSTIATAEPPTNVAAYVPQPEYSLTIKEASYPKIKPDEIVIENRAVAIQPLDAKMHNAGYGGGGRISYPFILGTSCAGEVFEVGEGVQGIAVGDRVFADTPAYIEGDARYGTWQKYVVTKASTVASIGNADFEKAVALAFPLETAIAALHEYLGMAKPGEVHKEGSQDEKKSEKVLIWGAGSAVGSCAVQYARAAEHTVITTASAHDAERQKKLGVSKTFDYKSSSVVDDLRAEGPYKYIFTASGDPASQKAIAAILGSEGGQFGSVLGGDVELPANVKRVYDAFSMAAQKPEHADFAKWLYGEVFPLVLEGDYLQIPKYEKRSGGLSALQDASRDVFEGKVRAKLVIDPQEE